MFCSTSFCLSPSLLCPLCLFPRCLPFSCIVLFSKLCFLLSLWPRADGWKQASSTAQSGQRGWTSTAVALTPSSRLLWSSKRLSIEQFPRLHATAMLRRKIGNTSRPRYIWCVSSDKLARRFVMEMSFVRYCQYPKLIIFDSLPFCVCILYSLSSSFSFPSLFFFSVFCFHSLVSLWTVFKPNKYKGWSGGLWTSEAHRSGWCKIQRERQYQFGTLGSRERD